MPLTKTILLIIAGLSLAGCNGSDSDSDSTQGIQEQEQEQSSSVARQWNEVLLSAIRSDFARPTVHARNLFHISSAMYDAWAILNKDATPYLAGSTVNNYQCDVKGISATTDIKFQEEAVSYAAFRLIDHRFFRSPGAVETQTNVTNLMTQLGFDSANSSTDYENGGAAELGNYIANCYIEYGLLDGSNEQYGYNNQFYLNENSFIEPALPGNPNAIANNNYNSWQPISLSKSIDQSGNEVENTPPFLSPEWGNVLPFSMSEDSSVTKIRNGNEYKMYFDPGSPPLLGTGSSEFYQWNFALVSMWSSHLDPQDGVMIDISPKTLGNNPALPSTNSLAAYQQFYSLDKGGDASQGYAENPVTGQPYQEQPVPRGDYVRALAEFWADGPESETPPGHWFVIMNEVFEHPLFERRFAGSGDIIGPLEWDVKAYFALGAAMHDSAIAAWSIKGYYDYLRPVSAIRLMTDLGQSSDPAEANYHPLGIPLFDGYIELVNSDDPLAGTQQEHTGKVKVKAWRGPDYIQDTSQDAAGVGWILAENWWPYQRPSFVSPPFSGFISGHSTYSRAATELLTRFTGSAYFPGGMSEFTISANEFLVFEKGPSVDLTLQWATYRDASDQCSLSRIWGGIHPPIDDIPGRKIGEVIGNNVFEKATSYF
jgi:hypothetical protein